MGESQEDRIAKYRAIKDLLGMDAVEDGLALEVVELTDQQTHKDYEIDHDRLATEEEIHWVRLRHVQEDIVRLSFAVSRINDRVLSVRAWLIAAVILLATVLWRVW